MSEETEEQILMQRINNLREHIIECLPESETYSVTIFSLFMVMTTCIKMVHETKGSKHACDIIKDLIKRLNDELDIAETHEKEDLKHD